MSRPMRHGNREVTAFLVIEVLLFSLASLAHGGWLLQGLEHQRASIADAVVAVLLGLGLFACLARPGDIRIPAMLVQGVAIIGVMVGIVMSAYGLGPKTAVDMALYGLMLITLVGGFITALKHESY